MASETVSSDHSTVSEKLEKEVHEEAKTMEENVSQPKVSEEKPKEEEVPSGTTPLAEAEVPKEKESEPPTVEEVVKAEVEKKPKSAEPIITFTSDEPKEKIEDKQIEPTVAEDVKKPDDIPVVDVPLPSNAELTKDSVPEVIKSEGKEQLEVKDVEKLQEESTKEAVEEKVEQQPKKIEIPESATESVKTKEEKAEQLHEKTEVPISATETVDVKELLNKIEIPKSVIAESKEVQAEELPPKEPETAEGLPEKTEVPVSATEVVGAKEEKVEELPEKTEISESTAETVETKEGQPAELLDKAEIPESAFETVDVKELLNKIEIPESVIAESKEVQGQELPPKEPEKEAVKDVDIPVAEDKKEEAPVPGPEVEDKPQQKPGITEQIEEKSAVSEPAEKLEVEARNDKEIPTGKIKDAKVAEEVAIGEPVASESSDQVTSTLEEVHIVRKNVEVPPPVEGAEKTAVEDKEREAAKTETEKPVKVEEKIEKETEEAKDEKIEEKEDKTVVSKELTQPEVKEVEDVPITISPEAGKIIEETSREIELPVENGSKKDETVASDETTKDVEIEKKVDVEEPSKADETEAKGEEPEPAEPKLEQQEKEVKESAATDVPIEKSTKETDDLKMVQDAPKKQSNNLLAKMKQSLVKAKKAITGKSQSKTPPSETKDEVKAT